MPTPCVVTLLRWMVLWASLMIPAGVSWGEEDLQVISGVLESIDSATGKAVIRTDLGRPIFVDITKPYLLERIVQGERVTIQVNQRGEAVKVIDAPVPELKHPAPN